MSTFSFWVHFILILNCKLFGSSVHRHDIDQKMKFEFIVWQNWYWCSSQASIALTYFNIFRTSPAWTRSPRWPWCGLSSSSSASLYSWVFLEGRLQKRNTFFGHTPKNGGSPREKVHRCQTDGSSLNQKSFFFWESTLNDVLWGKRLNNIFSVLSFCSNSRR